MSRELARPGARPACGVCESTAVTKSVRFRDSQVYRCRACGFRFSRGGTALEFAVHYDERYFDRLRQRDEMSKWRAIYQERIDFLKDHAPGRRLLEAGAGASTFAITAAGHGFDVTVIDGSPWAVQHLTAQEGIEGCVADLNEVELPERRYHAVHCSHVLEHLSNPKGFLAACFNGLGRDGLIYLSFPVYEPAILWVRDWCYRLGLANYPYNYQAPDHLSYFGARCIHRTLSGVGFSIERFRRTKFVSLHDSFERMSRDGVVRKIVFGLSRVLTPVTTRLGFHRDVEIIARRAA